MNDLSELPKLEEIFGDLRRGRHICAEDGMAYYHLRDQFREYRRLFAALGFDLQRHDQGFFYFCDRGELGKQASEMAVFFFVFVDALGDEGASIRETLFEQQHRVDDLPHFRRESHRQCLAEVGIDGTEDLRKVVRRLDRYGFAEASSAGSFRLRKPAWRFVELCYDAADDEETSDEVKQGER